MFCKKCGKEIDDQAVICPECGVATENFKKGGKPKKPIYKRVWFWLLIIFIGIPMLVSIGNGNSKTVSTSANIEVSSSKSESISIKESQSEKQSGESSATIESKGEGDIGKYHVAIKGIELAENYSGDPAVIVTYEWTNNSDESKAFGYALSDTVYQDGIECESSIIKIVTDDSDGKYKEIKPGKTLEFRYGYLLNDTTTDVEVEVSPWMSFSKNPTIISKTFKLNN